MNNASLEQLVQEYLYANIPISMAMGVLIASATPRTVVVAAPFANNINHKSTVFGGSLHAVATLACWSLLFVNLRVVRNEPVQIVIVKSEIDYNRPVDRDFEAMCLAPDEIRWEQFFKTLHRRGRARLELTANISQGGTSCVEYRGEFAAIKEQI